MGMDTVYLIMEVEKHFGIAIPDNKASQIVTVQDLVNCVAKLTNQCSNERIERDVLFIVSEVTGIETGKIKLQDRIVDNLGID